MNLLEEMGLAFCVLGVAVIVLRRPLGIGFCRLGKAIFKISPFRNLVDVESIYDEQAAPKRFLFMGAVSVVQGLLIILIGFVFF